jgi:ABC-type glycerol-3-phosphate transport system substrate-binding protein
MAQTYRFVDAYAADGQVYGMAQCGVATGVVYNKKVFRQAGVAQPPTTVDAFLAALTAVKESTDAVPLYTNYKDGWPLADLHRNLGAASGNADAKNQMTTTDAPWTEGEDAYLVDSLLYDAVDLGLTEADPTTTNWEESKALLGSGKIAAMVLQSWAIGQLEDAAADAGGDPADIGFLPVPAAAPGRSFAAVLGDRYFAVNARSENKAAARAWIDWVIEGSGYCADQGLISPLKSVPLPDNLATLTELGVELFEPIPAPDGREGLFDAIDSAAEIGFPSAQYRQELVDQARRHTPKAQAFQTLNRKWAAGRASAG